MYLVVNIGVWAQLSLFQLLKARKKKKSTAFSISKLTSEQNKPKPPPHNIPKQVWNCGLKMLCVSAVTF